MNTVVTSTSFPPRCQRDLSAGPSSGLIFVVVGNQVVRFLVLARFFSTKGTALLEATTPQHVTPHGRWVATGCYFKPAWYFTDGWYFANGCYVMAVTRLCCGACLDGLQCLGLPFWGSVLGRGPGLCSVSSRGPSGPQMNVTSRRMVLFGRWLPRGRMLLHGLGGFGSSTYNRGKYGASIQGSSGILVKLAPWRCGFPSGLWQHTP